MSTSETASEKREVCNATTRSSAGVKRVLCTVHALKMTDLALIGCAAFPTLDAVGPFDVHDHDFLMRGLGELKGSQQTV